MRKENKQVLALIAIGTAVDLISKGLVQMALPPPGIVVLIPGILTIKVAYNYGIFGGSYFIYSPWIYCFAFIFLVILGFLIFSLPPGKTWKPFRIGLSLYFVLGAGNVLDRLLGGRAVTDWLKVGEFATYNLADWFGYIGFIIILVTLIQWFVKNQVGQNINEWLEYNRDRKKIKQ